MVLDSYNLVLAKWASTRIIFSRYHSILDKGKIMFFKTITMQISLFLKLKYTSLLSVIMSIISPICIILSIHVAYLAWETVCLHKSYSLNPLHETGPYNLYISLAHRAVMVRWNIKAPKGDMARPAQVSQRRLCYILPLLKWVYYKLFKRGWPADLADWSRCPPTHNPIALIVFSWHLWVKLYERDIKVSVAKICKNGTVVVSVFHLSAALLRGYQY